MSKEEIITSISGVCDALIGRDVEKVLSFFTEDATLVWGSFAFEDRPGIKSWVIGLGEIFPKLNLRTMSLRIQGNKATHVFIIDIILQDDQRGQLPCTSEYEFRKDKILHVKFTLSYGYIIENERTDRSGL